MTEMTVNTSKARYIIDPVAFFGALIGGPILFTAATFWLLFVPVFALAMGGIPYLVIGAPVLLVHLRRKPPNTGDIAWVSFLAFAIAWLVMTLVLLAANPNEPSGVLIISAVTLPFGALFSACWGASFGWLYRALARDFYINAVAP